MFWQQDFLANPTSKHLGIVLDARLTSEKNLKVIIIKIDKSERLLRKSQNILPKLVLITIYKAFVRPHLDYSHVIYNKAYNETFHQKFESIQYNACQAQLGATWRSSREKILTKVKLGIPLKSSMAQKTFIA